MVRLCTDLGLQDAQEYATKLKKAEKNKELREQVQIHVTNKSMRKAMQLEKKRFLMQSNMLM